jgi:hypothetical protein
MSLTSYRYAVKSGDKVNLMVKPGYTPAPLKSTKPSPEAVPDITVSSANNTYPSSLATAAASTTPIVTPFSTSPASALYSAEFLSRACSADFWISLKKFLDGQLGGDEDQVRTAFETWLNASKEWLTPSQVAKIRDSVGITGMNGA